MPPKKKVPAKKATAKTGRTVNQAPAEHDGDDTAGLVKVTLTAHHEDHIPGDTIDVTPDEAAALNHAGVAGPRPEDAVGQ